MSPLVTIYYKSRWLNFFLTFVGLLFILYGVLVLGDDDGMGWLPWVIGGGLLAYLTIYSNKRR